MSGIGQDFFQERHRIPWVVIELPEKRNGVFYCNLCTTGHLTQLFNGLNRRSGGFQFMASPFSRSIIPLSVLRNSFPASG